MEHLETMKTQAGNLPPNTILSGFQGAAVSTHLPCDTRGPFLLGDSALSGSGSISGRMRSSQDLEELRQKPLDFVFLVEWERAAAPEGWAEHCQAGGSWDQKHWYHSSRQDKLLCPNFVLKQQ